MLVNEDIVEIDPATGEIGAEYGVPEPYDDSWRVAAMDKGSEQELTWWQREDQAVARVSGDDETPLDVEPATRPLGVPAAGEVAGQLLPPE